MKKLLDLPYEKTIGLVKVLKASLYEGHKVIIRQIGRTYFEYLLEYNGEIYSSYIIMTPAKGKKKLTNEEISQTSAIAYAGAEATLDALLGVEVDAETKKVVEIFEESRETVEGEVKEKNA